MSRVKNLIQSPFSLYLMVRPDATKEEFMQDTGGLLKDWYNTKNRITGHSLRDKGVRLPHSKAIIWLMINPRATKEEYIAQGFSQDNFYPNCTRALDLLKACNAATTFIKPLTDTLANRLHTARGKRIPRLLDSQMVQKPLDLPTPKLSLEDYWLSDSGEKLKPHPEMIPDLKVSTDTKVNFKPLPLLNPAPYKAFTDSSDIELRVKNAVDEMMTEMREQQQKAETYRARITALNAENFKLRAEVAELTEMINGNAV